MKLIEGKAVFTLLLPIFFVMAACGGDEPSCSESATCPAQTKTDGGQDSVSADAPIDDTRRDADASFTVDSGDANVTDTKTSDAAFGGDISLSDVTRADIVVDGFTSDVDAGSSTPCVPATPCDVPSKACRIGSLLCTSGGPVCAETDNKPNGSSCGTGMVCQLGVCKACVQGEACTPAGNACHTGALDCSGATPVCMDTGNGVTPGASCGQDEVCSASGTCVMCTAGSACQITGKPCRAGKVACDTGAPVCVESGDAPGGSSCGTNQVCSNGVCGPCVAGASCAPANACHAGTLSCSTGTPTCTDTGIALTDGASCGSNLVCSKGSCVACVSGTACQPSDPCKSGATSCATGTSVCVAVGNKPEGTSCGAGQSCANGQKTSAKTCDTNGQCTTPTVTTCATGFCDPGGTDCLVCSSGQTACAGTCCASGQGCCNNLCTTLNTTTHCGVCGNACVAGKVCSGTQCLWDDGHVCGGGADCGSGTCDGRCCAAGTSCKCTQPSAGNIVKNPGFDTDLSNWNIDSGPGTFTWTPRGTVDQYGYSGDAEQCQYSGSVQLSCDKGGSGVDCASGPDPNFSCQPMWQCLPVDGGATYNFGMMMSNDDTAGTTQCAVEMWTGPGCSGASTLVSDWTWVNLNWPGGFLNTELSTGANQSVRVYCYRCGGGTGRVDMVYLSKNPGGY